MPEDNFMNIKHSNSMDQLFCSPDGRSWNLQDSDVNITDRLSIISVPVRRYTNINDEYTILACTNMSPPMKIFYQLAVKRPRDKGFSATPDKDARILKRLLERAPISVGHYIEIEQKLLRKFADMRRREFLEKMKVKYYGTTTNDNKLAGTADLERSPLITPLQLTLNHTIGALRVNHTIGALRLVVSATDIRIIKLILQVVKHNVNKKETIQQNEGMLVTRHQSVCTRTLVRPVDFFMKVQIPRPLRIRQILMSTSEHQYTGTTEHRLHRIDITKQQDANPSLRSKHEIIANNGKPMLDNNATAHAALEINAHNDTETLVDGDDGDKDMKLERGDDDVDKYMDTLHDDDDEDCFGILGVYCRSDIHGDYSGVTSAQRKIG